MFECAYAQLVLPWYVVPEPCEHQPLHQVLSREVDFVIDRIIERAKDFDVCQAVVGSIRILTQHLHNAKQSDRCDFAPTFSFKRLTLTLLQLLFALNNVSELYKCLHISLPPMNNYLVLADLTCSDLLKVVLIGPDQYQYLYYRERKF